MVVVEKYLKCLIVDDDADDILMVREMLEEHGSELGLMVHSVSSIDDFFVRLSQELFDLYLLDYRMEIGSGLELLKVLRQKSEDVPVIMLTGQGDQETVVEALRLGATDYVNKNRLNPEGLVHSIERACRLYSEAREKKELARQLTLQSEMLTGLSEAVSSLLRAPGHRGGIQNAIETMGKACGADGAILILHDSRKTGESGEWEIDSLWNSTEGGITFDQAKALISTASNRSETLRILERFWSGDLIQPLTEIPSFGYRNSILLPIRVQKSFWGVLVLGSDAAGFEWSAYRQSCLQTFAGSLGWELKRNHESFTLHELVEQTSGGTGEEFFEALVKNLSNSLSVQCAQVFELVERGLSQARLLKGWDGKAISKNEIIELRNSPAEEILCGMYSFYPEKVAELFPHETAFEKMDIESFAAVPFFDSEGKILGYLSVVSRFPLVDSERILSMLRMFGARAGAELERQRSEAKIRTMAYYDSLTELPNRVLLNDRLEVALRQACRNNSQVAVLYLDFDRFKSVNDNYGHLVGDLLLKEGARRLQECLRKGDTVSRLGGDEFVIVLPDIRDSGDIARLALKINAAIKAPFNLEPAEIKTSVSVGIAIFPRDGKDSVTLIKKADKALFNSKKSGRDSFSFSEPDHPEKSL